MSMYDDLFDGPLPAGTRSEPAWPGYDVEPVAVPRQGVLGRIFRRRVSARHAA